MSKAAVIKAYKYLIINIHFFQKSFLINFFIKLIHAFLNAYYVSGSVLGPGNEVKRKIDSMPVFLYSFEEEINN